MAKDITDRQTDTGQCGLALRITVVPPHINLEVWRNPVAKGVRNKIVKKIHIIFR